MFLNLQKHTYVTLTQEYIKTDHFDYLKESCGFENTKNKYMLFINTSQLHTTEDKISYEYIKY